MLYFCPECRNADVEKEIVETAGDVGVAACPDCGTHFEFPYHTLFTLEGAPTSGKSTTAGRLDGDIDLAICEGDLHAGLTAGRLSWPEMCDLDFRLCLLLHDAGAQTLFVGGMHPHDIADSPETRYFDGVERCALVCSDAELRRRLRERDDASEETIENFQGVNRWYREEGPQKGIHVVDTTERDPADVTRAVTSWLDARRSADSAQ
jgi:hypothetical protein